MDNFLNRPLTAEEEAHQRWVADQVAAHIDAKIADKLYRDFTDRYIRPAAAALRAEAIETAMRHGVSREEAERFVTAALSSIRISPF